MAQKARREKAKPLVVVRTRRSRSFEERRQVVEETFQPGASVALVARAHGVRANQVFHWRKLYREGRLEPSSPAPTTLLPVHLTAEEEPRRVSSMAPLWAPSAGAGVIHIELRQAQVRVEGAADPHCLRAVLETLGRR